MNRSSAINNSIKVYDPEWGSKLASTIIELEKLRVKKLGGPVPPYIFFQLKNIFHKLESLGSARIEGNNTTLAKFVEKILEDPQKTKVDEGMQEILNIEKAIEFIEHNVSKSTVFNRALISEIHKIIVKGLSIPSKGEGSRDPGNLRKIHVKISRSTHVPPEPLKVSEYFDELIEFISRPVNTQYHLLVMAIAHHRMAWIHPFDNGNGRLVRMFTYALLIKQGFEVKSGRILNPTAMFCMDRERYYKMLSGADSGDKIHVLAWCLYVLEGLKVEIEKIDKLLDLAFVTNEILLPTVKYALDRQLITTLEYKILSNMVIGKDMILKSADLRKIIGQESPEQRSRILKKLKEKKILLPLKTNGRIYTLGFTNNYLLRGIMYNLEQHGFIPAFLN